MMTRCIRPRAGAAWPAAIPLIPYMRSNLSRKRRGLASADAVIAVSAGIAADLEARAPELVSTRIAVIPNPVDIETLRDAARSTWRFLMPYVSMASAWVFSRLDYAWEGLDPSRITVIPSFSSRSA